MSPTRRLRSLLAEPRRGFANVWAVMTLVLALVSVHVLCSVHLDDQDRAASASGYAAGHTHGGVNQSTAQDTASPPAAATVVMASIGSGSTPVGSDSHGCTEHHTATGQCDPVLPQPPGSAVVPDLAVQWLVHDVPQHEARTAGHGTISAAPSLHALGISRT